MHDHTATTERADDTDPAGTDNTANDAPKIYVACLASYNAGILYGCWIDVTDPDEIWDAVRAMLAESPTPGAEEWSIHDYEGFEGADISEYASFETVCDLAEFAALHGRLGGKLLAHFGQNLDEARTAFEDYAGEYKSLTDFAEELTEQSGIEIPENLRYYIDYEAMGRDLELGGDVFTIETGFEEIHIFWSR
jgi:antirestriction protein